MSQVEVLYHCSRCKKAYPKQAQKDACMTSHGLVKVKSSRGGYDWLKKRGS